MPAPTLSQLGFTPERAAEIERLGGGRVAARVLADGKKSWPLGGCEASSGELAGEAQNGPRPVVGDWVAVADSAGSAVIHAVLDRRTALVRRSAGSVSERQLIATNLDICFIVTSANRDLNPRRVERYLAAVWDSGARPVVVLNKVDLGGDIDGMVGSIAAVGSGVDVLPVSAASGTGLDAFAPYLQPGVTVALVGSSGVGKSSLLNRLRGEQLQEVRPIVEHDKGVHTTTRREMFLLPSGGVLIDTAGMREFGLVADGGGIDKTFPEIAALVADCRFADCSHENEPDCAVNRALGAGTLLPERLANYQKLRKEVATAAAPTHVQRRLRPPGRPARRPPKRR